MVIVDSQVTQVIARTLLLFITHIFSLVLQLNKVEASIIKLVKLNKIRINALNCFLNVETKRLGGFRPLDVSEASLAARNERPVVLTARMRGEV